MKVQLISAKHEEAGRTIYPLRPQIGLEIIASVIELHCPEAEIEIFDGEITPHKKILNSLDADYVGLSSWYSNHKNTLEIAKVAKENGCTTIFGGPNATHLARNILKNHSFVDYAIIEDGEYALTKLIKGCKTREIENLFYRENNEIRFTFEKQVNINELPVFNLEHSVDSERYFEGENEERDDEPFPISCIRGCIKAVKRDRCSFCSLPCKGVRLLNPQKVWEQIRFLKGKYGFDYFFESGDNFIVGNYPEKLLEQKSLNLDISLRIYERVNTINSENVNTLKKLGVKDVLIGFEHIDKDILKSANKLYNIAHIWEEIKLLENHDIELIPAFMFGLPGETVETARRNYEFIEDMIDKYSNISKMVVSIAIPLVGSALFNKLLLDEKIVSVYNDLGWDLLKDDIIDYDLLTRLMIETYCDISPNDLAEVVRETKALLPENKVASCGRITL